MKPYQAVVFVLSLASACGSSAPTPSTERSAPVEPVRAEPAASPVATEEPSETMAVATPAESETQPATTETSPYPVTTWQHIVMTYVTEDGGFRYQALRDSAEDLAALDTFLEAVAEARPSEWPQPEQLAFYINAYNALTVRAVIRHWPVTSVVRVPGFFDRQEYTVAGESLTLNALETTRIREPFSEPRIHFLVNCASVGCPALMNYAYLPANLESSLEERARHFVRETTVIDRPRRTVRMSQIFEWYADDFGGLSGVREFIAARLDPDDAAFVRDDGTRLRTFPYDWNVNARP